MRIHLLLLLRWKILKLRNRQYQVRFQLCQSFLARSNFSVIAVVTVEKAAAAKIFFECHYNGLSEISPRSLRRRQLEGALHEDTMSSSPEKDERRQSWAKKESDHLRETRVMKARRLKALKGRDLPASKYEVVKVLHKIPLPLSCGASRA